MNEIQENTIPVPAWRLVGVPILVTFVAVAFWMEYYGSIGWWPAVLFAIWAAHYARYTVKSRGEGNIQRN